MSLSKQVYRIGTNQYLDIYIFVDHRGDLWFKAKEAALAMAYVDTDDAIRKHTDAEDKRPWSELLPATHRVSDVPAYWKPNTVFINESGLYSLILRSKKPEARAFKRWVTADVLPSIRKTGAYVSPDISREQTEGLLTGLVQRLEKKDKQLEKKDEQLMKKDEQLDKLIHKILDDKPRLAVMPQRDELKHELRVYRKDNTYKFIRAQKRSINKLTSPLEKSGEYEPVLQRPAIPNGVNVLNAIKEQLPATSYSAKYNEIKTEHDVVGIVQSLVEK